VTVWTHDLLDALRQIGDPLLDPVGPHGKASWWDIAHAPPADDEPTEYPSGKKVPEPIRRLRTWRRSKDGARPKKVNDKDWFWAKPTATPIDPRQLEIAHSLFAAYGGEIGASLLLASIPNAYAAAVGASVLAATGELSSHARRRIGETAQLLIDVLFPERDRTTALLAKGAFAPIEAFPVEGRGFRTVRTTRLTHAVIRELLLNSPAEKWNAKQKGLIPAHPETLRGLPINQEDLLGTLGTFTVTTFEVMEKLGVPWNDDAEHAYLMLWDRVGELLGIGTREVTNELKRVKCPVPAGYDGALRPKSVADARALQDLIRDRVWPLPTAKKPTGPFDNANGKILVRALLDELQVAMPRGLLRLPVVVMRYLVHPSAHELLGLGGGGLPDSVMRWPSVERFVRGPAHRPGTGLVERSMRIAATDISRRAFIHFVREREDDDSQADFVIPFVDEDDTVISRGRGGIGPA
jgi:hypothetical protein